MPYVVNNNRRKIMRKVVVDLSQHLIAKDILPKNDRGKNKDKARFICFFYCGFFLSLKP